MDVGSGSGSGDDDGGGKGGEELGARAGEANFVIAVVKLRSWVGSPSRLSIRLDASPRRSSTS